MQEALAAQHARSAAGNSSAAADLLPRPGGSSSGTADVLPRPIGSSSVAADLLPRPGSPWDSAWDEQSAAYRQHSPRLGGSNLATDLSGVRSRTHSQGVFGSIVTEYRPAGHTYNGNSRSRYAGN